MYKTGIFRKEDLPRVKTVFGTRRAIAYNLLSPSDLPASDFSAADQDVAAFERTIATVRLSCGVFRTTYRSRLANVDAATAPLVASAFGAGEQIHIEDWAASDALVSSEWAAVLLRDYPAATFRASDYLLYLVEARRGGETYVLEPDGSAIQYIRPPFVVSTSVSEQAVYPVNRLVSAWGSRTAAKLRQMVLSLAWGEVTPGEWLQLGEWRFRQISLLHPDARKMARECPRFTVSFHDAFRPALEACHLVRAMNIYNPDVFGADRVREGLRAALLSLRAGGILIVGRTREEGVRSNHASIFWKGPVGPELLAELGEGFEMRDDVLAIRS